MRRLGGHISTSGGIINAVNKTLAIGGNAIQIFAGSPRMWARSLYPTKVAEEFKEAVVKHDLNPVYIHALYLTNLASDNSELVQKSKLALISDLNNCALIDGAGVVLHIGSHQGRGWESSRNQVVSVIRQIFEETSPQANLLLENSAGQKGKIGSLPELHDLLSTINNPRLKVCLDTAHAFEAGYNLALPAGLNIWISEIEKYLSYEKLALLHLNDSKTPLNSGHDMHQNIGDGYIGSEGLKKLINHPKLAHLPLILEVPGLEGDGPDKVNLDRVKALLS